VVGKKIRRAQKACEGSTPSARTTFRSRSERRVLTIQRVKANFRDARVTAQLALDTWCYWFRAAVIDLTSPCRLSADLASAS